MRKILLIGMCAAVVIFNAALGFVLHIGKIGPTAILLYFIWCVISGALIGLLAAMLWERP